MSKGQTKKLSTAVIALDPVALSMAKAEEDAELKEAEQLAKGAQVSRHQGTLDLILKSLKQHELQRMSFEVNPMQQQNSWGSLYRMKSMLTPDHIIKRITGPQGDDLVCQILQARSNYFAQFGRPQTSRFALGFNFDETADSEIPEDQEDTRVRYKKRINHLKEVLWNCGYKGIDDEYFHPNLSQFMKMIVRDGLAYGRFAVEFIWSKDSQSGEDKCHGFRAVDAGTIYRVIPHKESDQSVRQEAIRLISELKNEKLDPRRFIETEDYKWVQVIEGKPVQAFTEKELVVYNLYPVTNVEYNGYPLTPIDQALNAITTHINIGIHNRLYFQNGRAAKGFLTFQSDDVDESTVQKIRLQFHQSINSVTNSWRMPVFGIGAEDKLTWQPIDAQGRDAEFQYLSDNNCRVILSSFQMSPEELPGYAHLARGTNTQALSEGDNEWKLTAARDVGLRPLICDVQDFFNTHVIPKFDQEVGKNYQFILSGLDADSPEKEATRLSQDMAIHMTYNDVLERVEKEKIAKELGGDLPMNPQFNQQLQAYLTVGEILENFFGRKGAAADPRYNYVRDPFWLQAQQLNMQKMQMAMQQQMAQQQAMQGGDPNAQGGPQGGGEEGVGDGSGQPPQDEQAPPGADETQKSEVTARNLERRKVWLAQNYSMLSKSIKNNGDTITKMILARHTDLVNKQMSEWEKESKKALNKIIEATRKR
jgi:hypothetical protein